MSEPIQKPPRSRCVGIDYGHKRVGLAVSDPLWMFAQPAGTFSPPKAIEQLRSIDMSDGIGVIVVGWPLMPDGTEGRATRAVEAYVDRVQRVVPDASIVRWDEHYTTELAREQLRNVGPRKKWRGRRGRVDSAAASIILQEYLDAQRRPADAEPTEA